MIQFDKIITLGQFADALNEHVNNQEDMNRFIDAYYESEKGNLSFQSIIQNMDFVLSYFFSDNKKYQDLFSYLQIYKRTKSTA
jgi:hypothetical protein